MYNGENKTAICSQKQIAKAMLHLLKEEKYTDISICKICKEAHVSRQTFYSLFQSKENIILFLIQQACHFPDSPCESCSQNQNLCKEQMTLSDLCQYYSAYICANYEFLGLLVKNNLLDLLFDSFRDAFLSCISVIPPEYSQIKEEIAYFVAGGISSIIRHCIHANTDNPPKDLEQLMRTLFSGVFFLK